MIKRALYLCMCIFLLVACTSSDEKKVNSIVIALSSEPETGFDPCLGWGRDGNPLIQSTLVTLNNDMAVENDLATKYFLSDDALTWTFSIRDDVKFSDGSPLRAEDVVFTFETAKKSASAVDLTSLEYVKALDATTVEFKLKKPHITFIYTIAQTGIVPRKHYSESYAQKPLGSGPFTLLQWDAGEQVIFGVNKHYYGKKPSVERVTVLFMSDESAYAAAQSGNVDVAVTNMNLAKNQIQGMNLKKFVTIDNRGMTLPTIKNTNKTNAFSYPIGNNVTSDVAVRRALSYGINREQLVSDVLNGYARVAYSECDGMPWAGDDAKVEYNLDRAKKILDGAGWIVGADGIRYKDDLKAEFALLYSSSDPTRLALASAVAYQAKKLGISIIIQGKSWDEIEKEMHSKAVLMGFGSQHPIETYYLYHSSNKGRDFYNPEYYENSEVDSHLEEALAQRNFDDFIRLYKKVQWDSKTGVSTKGDIPFLWLVNVDHLYFVNNKLNMGKQKIHPHGHSWPVLENLNEWTWTE